MSRRTVVPPPTKYGAHAILPAKARPATARQKAPAGAVPPPVHVPQGLPTAGAPAPRWPSRLPFGAGKPAGPAVQPAAARSANKPPGKTYQSWDQYYASSKSWHEKHGKKPAADLSSVQYLYHATRADLRSTIRDKGLLPKDPKWNDSYDASKDGFLSMATIEAGAGAMGGTSILLRVAVADVSGYDFKQASATEVRTTQGIGPEKLEIRDGSTWAKLKGN